MGFCFYVCSSLLSYSLSFVSSQADAAAEGVQGDAIVEGTVFIDWKSPIGTIDDDFICATLDWWPPEKCDYGTCSWGLAGLLNLVCFFFPVAFLLLNAFLFCQKSTNIFFWCIFHFFKISIFNLWFMSTNGVLHVVLVSMKLLFPSFSPKFCTEK